MPWPARLALDVVLVVVFAALGRASHAEENPLLGAAGTASPFLGGTLVGWGLVRWRSRRWPIGLGPGILVWASTLVIGMILRVFSGAGTAPSFVLVAATVLALLLLGSRWLAGWLAGRAGPARPRR